MTGPTIAIDYLARCPELIEELARLSWNEWQEIYQQRKQTLELIASPARLQSAISP